MENRSDIIVFGATGVTGKSTLPYLHKLAKDNGRALTWGIAGRSEKKLQDVLIETAKKIGVEKLDSVPIIIADISDEQSIKNMTARAKVIINCCGPFNLYGEIVIKSCIETGTHYVDVTGETQFMELMEMNHFKAAAEKGVYVVNACGFDSVAAELGLVFLEKNFQGCLNSAEIFVHGYEEGGDTPGPMANYGTWDSAVNEAGNLFRLYTLRKNKTHKPLPALKPKLSLRFPFSRVNVDGKGHKWPVPFLFTDYDIIKRSQYYFYESNKKRPIQANVYMMVDSFTALLKVIFFGILFGMLSQFRFGRNLLLQYPEFFSNGLFSKEEPSEEKMSRLHFSFTFRGEGWSEKLTEGEDQYQTPPDKTIVGQLRGTNPGYGFTCIALTLCAIMILTERNKLPSTGGVYTPAVAFSKTSLIEQIQKNGPDYEILPIKDI